MMLLLCLILLTLLLISYYLFNDIMSFSVLALLMYFISAVVTAINVENWGTKICGLLVVVTVVGCVAFILGELTARTIILKNRRGNTGTLKLKKINVQRPVLYFVIAVNILITIMLYRDIAKISSTVGMSLNGVIAAYKQNTDKYSISGLVMQLMKITKGSAFVCAAIYCNNFITDFKKNRFFNADLFLLIPGLLYCIQCILRGGRYTVIAFLIGFVFFMYFIRQSKNQWKYRIPVKQIVKVLIGALIIIYAFWFYKNFVGRTSEATLFDYTSKYLGGNYDHFNQFLLDSTPRHNGSETFAALIESVNKLFDVNIESVSTHEFRYTATGIMTGNSYSGMRNYYSDFGIVGVFLLCYIYSLLFSYIYSKLIKTKNLYGNFFLLIFYGSIIYCAVFHFFTDYFFARISIGYFIEILIMFLVYKVIMRTKFSFSPPK